MDDGPSDPFCFPHERLDVYKVAREFSREASGIVADLPRGSSDLGDQLQRAATSIVLNIAEGAGEFSSKEKARFYRIASRSAAECAAALDLAKDLYGLDPARAQRTKALLQRAGAMLTKLARLHEGRRA